MPTFIAGLGQQMLGEAAHAGMGLILGGINDRRQLRQQQKLQEMQIAGSKELTKYNTDMQMEMWKNTNYPAQMEMMKKAGLSPGLMYGIGGGGGTTANISQGQASGGDAPKGGAEATQMMAMGLQNSLLNAQRENIEADTENKKADTVNKGKDTELKSTQISTMDVANEIAGKTQNAQIGIVMEAMRKAHEEADMAVTQNKLTKETAKAQAEQIKTQAANAVIQGELLKIQKEAASKGNTKLDEEIKKIQKEVAMIDNYWKLDDYVERKKIDLIDKGINVSMIQNIMGTILSLGGIRR